MSTARQSTTRTIAAHGVLILYTLIALFPVFVIVVNSFKSRRAIFADPLALPTAETFDLIGYRTVLQQGDFLLYFQNSMIVTVGSLFFVLLFGAMAAFALSEYRFRGNSLMGLYLALGIMIPIRLGTVAILQMMVASGLVNTLTALILVLAANTAFNGFPVLGSILAQDRFLPRQLHTRGDRLTGPFDGGQGLAFDFLSECDVLAGNDNFDQSIGGDGIGLCGMGVDQVAGKIGRAPGNHQPCKGQRE